MNGRQAHECARHRSRSLACPLRPSDDEKVAPQGPADGGFLNDESTLTLVLLSLWLTESRLKIQEARYIEPVYSVQSIQHPPLAASAVLFLPSGLKYRFVYHIPHQQTTVRTSALILALEGILSLQEVD